MKRSLLVAALLAIALTACSKKEETTTALPVPAVAPSLPNAAESAPEQGKPADNALPNSQAEQKPAVDSKPAN